LNIKVLFAALFIVVLSTTAAYASPATATANPEISSAPRQNGAPGLTIPSSLTYDVNGTLIAWVNATGHAVITSNYPGFSSFNFTIEQLYAMARISAELSNININTSTGIVNGNIDINARVVVKIVVYINSTSPTSFFYDHTASSSWPVKWVLPWGDTKNFTIPWAAFSIDPTNPGSTTADTVPIRFVDANKTMFSTSYTVEHRQWDFSTWLQNKIQTGLNDVWGKVLGALQNANIPGFQGGFNVVRCKGQVDVWKTNGTNPDHALLMASGVIDLLIDFSMVGHGTVSFSYLGHAYTLHYDINVFVEFGLYFSLTVTSNWQVVTAQTGGHYSYNDVLVQVPINATLVWRKVGVIVYYGSPAHGISVTGGTSWGNTTYGGQVLFFVDYGWDGTPDFATNGTGQPLHLPDLVGSVTGSGTTRTVTLTKGSGSWGYFNLDTSGYAIVSVKRSDGVTLNASQYWQYQDLIGNRMLYVCDDPAYSYTIEMTPLTTLGGLPMPLLIVAALAVVVVVAGLLVLRSRKASSVSIK
jgi:hypothetical protein